MKSNTTTAWALQRPTGELMPAFVRDTRAEVISSVAAHMGQQANTAQHWRHMRSKGFRVVRVAVLPLTQSNHQHVQ